MYYYTQYNVVCAAPTLLAVAPLLETDKLRHRLETQNINAAKTVYFYNTTVLTNFNNNVDTMTPFSELT